MTQARHVLGTVLLLPSARRGGWGCLRQRDRGTTATAARGATPRAAEKRRRGEEEKRRREEEEKRRRGEAEKRDEEKGKREASMAAGARRWREVGEDGLEQLVDAELERALEAVAEHRRREALRRRRRATTTTTAVGGGDATTDGGRAHRTLRALRARRGAARWTAAARRTVTARSPLVGRRAGAMARPRARAPASHGGGGDAPPPALAQRERRSVRRSRRRHLQQEAGAALGDDLGRGAAERDVRVALRLCLHRCLHDVDRRRVPAAGATRGVRARSNRPHRRTARIERRRRRGGVVAGARARFTTRRRRRVSIANAAAQTCESRTHAPVRDRGAQPAGRKVAPVFGGGADVSQGRRQ